MSPPVKGSSKGRILLCLDGSADSAAAGRLVLSMAVSEGRPITAAHVYDSRIHETRFRQMEPGLPEKYQDAGGIKELRNSHGTLMSDGFEALSHGYLHQFTSDAKKLGVSVDPVVEEGRNYVKLLEIARRTEPEIAAFGAAGLGDMGDGMLGSAAVRLLRNLPCDVLVARASTPDAGPILSGIDGSDAALGAMEKALSWAGILDEDLELAAAYDPSLHQQVFRAMADAMPPAAQEAVGLDKQKDLHETLIDEGLGTLYRSFLEEASRSAAERGNTPATHLVADKAYIALTEKAAALGARMICLGRFGHNREMVSDIGATAEAVARNAHTSVLITAESNSSGEQAGEENDKMPWDEEAKERLKKVPRFVRKAAKRSIESAARSEGAGRVTVEHVKKAGQRFRSRRGG